MDEEYRWSGDAFELKNKLGDGYIVHLLLEHVYCNLLLLTLTSHCPVHSAYGSVYRGVQKGSGNVFAIKVPMLCTLLSTQFIVALICQSNRSFPNWGILSSRKSSRKR